MSILVWEIPRRMAMMTVAFLLIKYAGPIEFWIWIIMMFILQKLFFSCFFLIVLKDFSIIYLWVDWDTKMPLKVKVNGQTHEKTQIAKFCINLNFMAELSQGDQWVCVAKL